jgi:hypothetical protein
VGEGSGRRAESRRGEGRGFTAEEELFGIEEGPGDVLEGPALVIGGGGEGGEKVFAFHRGGGAGDGGPVEGVEEAAVALA